MSRRKGEKVDRLEVSYVAVETMVRSLRQDGVRVDTMLSVVIPSCGTSARLHSCLSALAGQTIRPGEIRIVCPAIDAVKGMTGSCPNTQVVPWPAGGSFCQAINQGIAATGGEWILVLNDDVILDSKFVEQLLSGIPADERVGMVCGKLLSEDGRTIDSTGQFLTRARTARERGYRMVDRGQFNTPGYVFSVPGATALYRRRMLEELAVRGQYFDEDLGMYLEDLDLGWRAQRAGWRAYYVPEAVGFHMRGATAKTRKPYWRWLRRYYLPWLSPELQARYIINRYRLILRYDSLPGVLWDSPWILWYEMRLWAYLLCIERKALRLVWRKLGYRACTRPALR